MNLNSNWLKDLRTELFKDMYQTPIHPKNLWLKKDPLHHHEVDEIYRANIESLHERGTWTRPYHTFAGARLLPESDQGADEQKWQEIKGMWAPWD
jgi:hypothetical protein